MYTRKLKSYIVNVDDLQLVYNLIFQNALYCFECYKQGYSKDDENYSFVYNVTEDEGEAEELLDTIVMGRVYPVHIKEIAEDYFIAM